MHSICHQTFAVLQYFPLQQNDRSEAMTELVRPRRFGLDEKLKGALLQHKALSFDGMSERLFGLLFSGLVYPQIWEDPEIDIRAMELQPHHRVATIASGGCNMLTYLAHGLKSIDVADLNASHIALNRLKVAAFAHLPSHPDIMRFFGMANEPANSKAYDRFIAPHLDAVSRRYWEGRRLTGKRRIEVFNGNFYRTGLLGRFIGASHIAARLYGIDLGELMQARTVEEQREFFDKKLAPIFDRKAVRWITARKSSLFGLGIPPRQFDELASLSDEKTLAKVLRERVEKLACDFPLNENYFAWQAFARRYPAPGEGKLPPYLTLANYAPIRDNLAKVSLHHNNFGAVLAAKADGTMDRFVLLDAQDWMTDEQLNAVWSEMSRTAADGARIIFRTAAEKSIVAGRLKPEIDRQWRYLDQQSLSLGKADRSAIYGGFHIYEKTA
jgi:S-adenosylmethionine-diacylglycerol 3-amino-3-carboxypropyl transferase